MSDTPKVCPFMSGVYRLPDCYRELAEVHEVYCIGERCMAWGDRGVVGKLQIAPLEEQLPLEHIYGCRLIP